MDIDAILKYKRPKETLYDLLGCHQSSTSEQINREYKIRALQLHPDKNPDPESSDRFKKLQEAKEILLDEKSRKSYDTWLNSGIQIPFEQWQSKKGHSMHWAPPRQTKLSIQEMSSSKQCSETFKGDTKSENVSGTASLLDKFRKYEI